MADIVFVVMSPDKPPGERLDPDFVAELERIAPVIAPKSVTVIELADNAVTHEKMADNSVGGDELIDNSVGTDHYAPASVDTAALKGQSVTAEKAGLGVSTAYDFAGNPIADRRVYCTAAQYASLTTKDPNTEYLVTA